MPTPCNAPSPLRPRAWLAGILLTTFAWLGAQPGAALAEADPAAAPPARPRIGLVLGGGGARGSAHVGVLKVLEEQRIPIDFIAGNSMGAIVGGLYASGMTPAEIEHELKTIDWNDVFDDEPPRPERSFRRKRDDDLYLVKPRAGLSDEGELKLPLALVQGQKFDLQLSRLTLHVANVHDFNRLPIPFRAVAADIETGKEVVLQSGNLARSIRASMAVPGAFDPVEIDGRLLVDGLVVNNVPVNVARDMGADILIVVDVGSGLYKREQIKNVLDVVAQLSNVLSERNVERQLATLKPADIFIQPDLGKLGAGDFDKAGEGIARGEQAARKLIPRLQHLAVDPGSYQQFLARRGTRAGPPVIQFVRLDNQSRLADATILSRLTVKPGEPLDRAKLDADIGLVYGLDVFESVRYEVVQENGQDGLVVHAKEKSWGPNYLQFGIELSNNFEGDSTYNLGALYTRTAINDLNGEIRVGLQLGQNPAAIAEWFQPLDPQSRYFTHVGTRIKQDQFSVYEDDEIVADYSILRGDIDLAIGRELGSWGEGRIGYRWAMGQGDVRIGDPSLDDYEFKLGQVYARLQLDTLDNVYFPHSGNRGKLEYLAAREAFGADSNYDQVVMQFTQAHSWGRNNLVGSLAFNTTLDDNAPPESRFRLGGFLRLSGYRPNQLSGQHAGLAGVMYYRRISDLKLLPAYLGGSLEYGNVWQDRDDIALDSGLFNGSVFLGADTPIGPLYLGLGAGEGGNNTVFLYLGPLF